jgi:hypothetical protein
MTFQTYKNQSAEFDLKIPLLSDSKTIEMTGKYPYLYHTRCLSFLRKLYRLTKAPKGFANMLS